MVKCRCFSKLAAFLSHFKNHSMKQLFLLVIGGMMLSTSYSQTPNGMRKVWTHWLLPFHYVYNMKEESGHEYRKRVRIEKRLAKGHKLRAI
jgi:hypothetical protein